MKKALSVALAVMLMFSIMTVSASAINANQNQSKENGGTFTVATYNVGGLPFAGSSSTKKSKQIAANISKWDITNVQENFTYNLVIRANLSKDVVSKTKHLPGFVGMDSFSKFAMKNVGYQKWKESYGGIANDNGADFYAAKGIRYYTVVLPNGEEIDVYNYHTDAGGEDTATDKNLKARRSNLTQLANLVKERSIDNDRAAIVMGDSNSRYTRTNDNLKEILVDSCGLTDAWIELVRNGEYPELGAPALTGNGGAAVDNTTNDPNCEKVDKIMYISSSTLKLQAVNYTDTKLELDGSSLSDHNPIVVEFTYSVVK